MSKSKKGAKPEEKDIKINGEVEITETESVDTDAKDENTDSEETVAEKAPATEE